MKYPENSKEIALASSEYWRERLNCNSKARANFSPEHSTEASELFCRPMVFIILRKPWGFCGKLHYIQIHLIPSCLLETIYKFSNCQASDSSVYMLLDLGFDITFLSSLLFLYCLLCWDYSLSLPSLNEDTWGPVLGPFPHQVSIYHFWESEESYGPSPNKSHIYTNLDNGEYLDFRG